MTFPLSPLGSQPSSARRTLRSGRGATTKTVYSFGGAPFQDASTKSPAGHEMVTTVYVRQICS